MPVFLLKILLVSLLWVVTVPAYCLEIEPSPSANDATLGLMLERAISTNLIAGGIVVVGNHDGILSTVARSHVNLPGAPPVSEHTIFDLASLTKVIATTPAIMKLLDEGKISLSDPLSRWFPEFRKTPRGDTTILNLLTHTSGLADFDLRSGQAMGTAVRKAAKEKGPSPGTSFNYADINFILLGELVHRASGKSLDAYCRDEIYTPLGANHTMFLPPRSLADSIAPTVGLESGTVQDRNSRRLGSVAGHAGLFSSAADLARFARMILGRGELDGRRILSERIISQMTVPYYCSSRSVIRALGWDMESPFSAPKGTFFSDASFGHTGYSGSSIWIDPKQDLFVIILTTRLNYSDTRMFSQFRRDISSVAAAGFSVAGTMDTLSSHTSRNPRDVPRIIRTAKASVKSKTIKLAALSLEKKQSKYPDKKKAGKKARRKQSGRIRRA